MSTKRGIQGKLACPFVFTHGPYQNTWKFTPGYLNSLSNSQDTAKITLKVDGECYWLDQNYQWWGRRDLRVHKKFMKLKKADKLSRAHFEETLAIRKDQDPAMSNWIQCTEPDLKGGHWFGWLPVTSSPKEFKYALEAINNNNVIPSNLTPNQTYELVGPKVQGNPYQLTQHVMVRHGSIPLKTLSITQFKTPESIKDIFTSHDDLLRSEGVVIWLNDQPAWKIHHGHIHDGNDQKLKAWQENPLIPDEFLAFIKDV